MPDESISRKALIRKLRTGYKEYVRLRQIEQERKDYEELKKELGL